MEETAPPIRLVMRNYFSTHLLYAARHLSDLAGTIEAGHQGQSRFDIEHRAYVLSSIQASAAFLEAMINELFQDAYDNHVPPDGYITPLPAQTRQLMAELWRGT